MDNKKTLYVALALVGGIIVGYMTGGSKISVQDQGASARSSKTSDAVNFASLENDKNILSTDPTLSVRLKEEQQMAKAGCTSSSRKYLKLVSPNGGESYVSQQSIPVSWVSCNYNPSTYVQIYIAYYSSGSSNITLWQSLGFSSNDGIENVILPPAGNPGGYAYGNKYKIFISDGTNPSQTIGSLYDFSDNLFAITPPFPGGCTSGLGFSTTTGMPCWITATPPTSVTSTSAVLNGYLFKNFPATINAHVIPSGGSMTGYIQSTPGTSSVNVSGLTPNTSYQFMMCTLNAPTYPSLGCGGPVISFTTLP